MRIATERLDRAGDFPAALGRRLSKPQRGHGMLQWFHRLVPKQAQFYPLFERHAAVFVEGARTIPSTR
jgi:hypothetical protein